MKSFITFFLIIYFMDSFFALCFVILPIVARITPANSAPSVDSEGNFLNLTGWWKTHSISDHCNWPGISCDNGGHVVRIHRYHVGISGRIPTQIVVLSKLKYLNLSMNSLTGELPLSLGNLTKLESLDISYNAISGLLPLSLGNLIKLKTLDVSHNQIFGSVIPEIGNLLNLVVLDLSGNNLNGSIHSPIGSLSNIVDLNLSGNDLTGEMPLSLGKLTKLEKLDLSFNKISGSVIPEIVYLSNLVVLDLSGNNLNGSIPTHIGALANLDTLYLSYNNICGPIPANLCHLTSLWFLSLQYNEMSGSIPTNIGNLTNLVYLNLGYNKFTGRIPSSLYQLTKLSRLSIPSNQISGNIHNEIGKLRSLSDLDLSKNNLSGEVPLSLLNLSSIDLSYNVLEGPIPRDVWCRFPRSSFLANTKLLNYTTSLPPCRHNNSVQSKQDSSYSKERHPSYIKIVLPLALLVPFMILGGCLLCSKFKAKKTNPEPLATKNGDIFKMWNFDGKIAYEDIIEATEDFDISNCIGTGGYGSVYRAELPNGRVVALKKLHRFEGENPTFDQCFRNEAKILSEIRHMHIVKLFGFCLHNRCMFLIYDYMERGSLFSVLRYEDDALELDWIKRVNVVKGIAHALSYMHHDCTPPILHRDISSSNILLNSKLEARLSDFGTARLLDPDSSNQTQIAGTRGYTPPPDRKLASDVVRVVGIALACLSPDPKSRPWMKDVSQEFLVREPPNLTRPLLILHVPEN